MTALMFIFGLVAGIVIATAVILHRLPKPNHMVAKRLEDYRQAALTKDGEFYMTPMPGLGWKVGKCFLGECGPVFITIRVFADEDDEFNLREAEELLSALKSN